MDNSSQTGGTVKCCYSANQRGYPEPFSQQEDKHCKPSRRTAWSKTDKCECVDVCLCVLDSPLTLQHSSLSVSSYSSASERTCYKKPAKRQTLTSDGTVPALYVTNATDSVVVGGQMSTLPSLLYPCQTMCEEKLVHERMLSWH